MLFLLVITYICSFQAVRSNSTESNPILRCAPFNNCNDHYAVAAFAKVTWLQANHICNSAGLVLATVNNWKQRLELMGSVAKTGNILGDKRFWLGATNIVEPNTWTWFSTGIPMTFNYWAKLEPRSDRVGRDGCLVMGVDEYWHSADCAKEFYFICENICLIDPNRDEEQIYI